MGQAKQRGSKDERIADARKRQANDLLTSLNMRHPPNRQYIAQYTSDAVTQLQATSVALATAARAYIPLLQYMWLSELRGACHSSSAALHIAFSELGLTSKLCIGVVEAGSKRLDHSWVEMSERVFDVAVSLPDPSGWHIAGPIFNSTDLFSGDESNLLFGIPFSGGLDPIALSVHKRTLAEYADLQHEVNTAEILNIWQLSHRLVAAAGMRATEEELESKYGGVCRELRCPPLKKGPR